MKSCGYAWQASDGFQLTCPLDAGHEGDHKCLCGCGEKAINLAVPEIEVILSTGTIKAKSIKVTKLTPTWCPMGLDTGQGTIFQCERTDGHAGDHLFTKTFSEYPKTCGWTQKVGNVEAHCKLGEHEAGGHYLVPGCEYNPTYLGALMKCSKQKGHGGAHHWEPYALVKDKPVIKEDKKKNTCAQYKCKQPAEFRLRLRMIEQPHVEYRTSYCGKHIAHQRKGYEGNESWTVLGLIEADT